MILRVDWIFASMHAVRATAIPARRMSNMEGTASFFTASSSAARIWSGVIKRMTIKR
jgi:hypothetical protein